MSTFLLQHAINKDMTTTAAKSLVGKKNRHQHYTATVQLLFCSSRCCRRRTTSCHGVTMSKNSHQSAAAALVGGNNVVSLHNGGNNYLRVAGAVTSMKRRSKSTKISVGTTTVSSDNEVYQTSLSSSSITTTAATPTPTPTSAEIHNDSTKIEKDAPAINFSSRLCKKSYKEMDTFKNLFIEIEPESIQKSFYLFCRLYNYVYPYADLKNPHSKDKKNSNEAQEKKQLAILSKDILNTKMLNFILNNLCEYCWKRTKREIKSSNESSSKSSSNHNNTYSDDNLDLRIINPAKILYNHIDALNPNTLTFKILMSTSYYDNDPVQKVTYVASVLEKMKSMSLLSGNNNNNNNNNTNNHSHYRRNHIIELDEESYNTVINAYANIGNAEKAEMLLKEMLFVYKNTGDNNVKPNVHNFTNVLTAWSRSKSRNAPERAERILNYMYELTNNKIIDALPNVVSYTSVLHCWAKSGRPESGIRAEQKLREMERISRTSTRKQNNHNHKQQQQQQQQQQQIISIRPNSISYSAVINAYASVGDAERAESILKEMYTNQDRNNETKNNTMKKNNNLNSTEPNVQIFNTVLTAWSRSRDKNAPERAQEILRKMQDLTNNNGLDVMPDAVSYNTVLHSFAKSKRYDSGEKAEEILSEMENVAHRQNDMDMRPNTISYSTVIDAYARVGNGERAEFILKEMYDSYINGNTNAQPDHKTFTSVLTAWSRSKAKDAPERAEAILMRMQDLTKKRSDDILSPDVVTFNTVLNCWARSGRRDAGQQAERILRAMIEMDNNDTKNNTNNNEDNDVGNRHHNHGGGGERIMMKKSLKPDTITYSTVISAYASIGDAEQAEIILKAMYNAYINGNVNAKPDVTTFNTVLRAWSKSLALDAPERAEKVLHRMKDMSTRPILNPLLNAIPNVISYNTLLHCWAKSKRQDTIQRAEEILRQMEINKVQPDVISYNTVINACASIGNADQAEIILKEMYDRYTKSGDKNAAPDVKTFNTVLAALSRSHAKNAPERARVVLERMHDLSKKKVLDVVPNIVSYTTVLHCWAKSKRNNAGEVAEAILREMQRSGDKTIQPNTITYNTIINTYTNINNANRADNILREMYNEYISNKNNNAKPDIVSFNTVLTAWSRSTAHNAHIRAQSIFSKMTKLTNNGILDVQPNKVTCKIMDVIEKEWRQKTQQPLHLSQQDQNYGVQQQQPKSTDD